MHKLTSFLLFSYLIASINAISFTIPATKEECFYEDVALGDAILFMFQVTAGGFLDADIQVFKSCGSKCEVLTIP
jgi:hypothetical protein